MNNKVIAFAFLKSLFFFSVFLPTLLLADAPVKAVAPVKIDAFDIALLPASYFSKDLSRAKDLMSKASWEDALQSLNNYIDKPPPRAPVQNAYLLKALCLQNLGKDADAVKAFDGFLHLHAASSDVIYLKALSVARLGQLPKAIALLEEASWFGKATFISAAQISMQEAILYRATGDDKKAQEKLTQLTAANPTFAPAFTELGGVYLEAANKVEALRCLRASLALIPNEPFTQIQLARALLLQSDRDNGQRDIGEARSLSKQLMENRNVTADLSAKAAEVYIHASIEARDLKEAEIITAQLIKKNPTDVELQRTREQIKLEKESAKLAAQTPAAQS